ncbi:MAG: hypothetical protein ACP5JT_05445 [Thermoplasmata archaeon]|jgi:hypothetical protein
MIVKLVGMSLINVFGNEARMLTFQIVNNQAGDSKVILSPEIKNAFNMMGMPDNFVTQMFQNIQQIANMQYTFTWIIYQYEYLELGINFDVGKMYEFIFSENNIKINTI